MWVVTPDVPVPLLLPYDGVHFMNEVVAGSPINFLDQARNIFVVDGRGGSTHKPPTPRRQLPLAVIRLLPPLIVVSGLRGGCITTGSLPSTGSSGPGADEAADLACTLLPGTSSRPSHSTTSGIGIPLQTAHCSAGPR